MKKSNFVWVRNFRSMDEQAAVKEYHVDRTGVLSHQAFFFGSSNLNQVVWCLTRNLPSITDLNKGVKKEGL
jgi:hypothetical protein